VRSGVHADLPFATDAVRNSVLINNDLVRTISFALDANQTLDEHASPKIVIVTVMTGEMIFHLDGQPHHLVAGDVVYLAPGQRHGLTTTAPTRMQLTMVETEGTQWAKGEESSPAAAAVAESER
jgi:quercetin dioxygenase-like cupin family protein